MLDVLAQKGKVTGRVEEKEGKIGSRTQEKG
jgi:hypothetical protein